MIILDEAAATERLPYDRLVPALREGLAQEWQQVQRVHYGLADDASMLLMPAWSETHLGLKVVNVFPGNAALGKSPITSTYLLHDAQTGAMKALIDGETLTSRRTAAVTALAASFLAPIDADHLLLVGAGRIAQELPAALSAVRAIRRVTIWSRSFERAAALARTLEAQGYSASPSRDLRKSVAAAPIIACATFSTVPLVEGEWLADRAFLSLIGGFHPHMREADSEAIRRSYVFADTLSGALAEAGDLLTPIAEGVITSNHVKADLFDLCKDRSAFPTPLPIPRVFKSVGHAIQDLIAATLTLGPGS